MAEQKVAPYGAWKSPITSSLIVSEFVGLGQLALDGEDVYWSEFAPFGGWATGRGEAHTRREDRGCNATGLQRPHAGA